MVAYTEFDDKPPALREVLLKSRQIPNASAEGILVYGQGGVEVENHTDKATEAWKGATSAQILRKETPDKIVSQDEIKELAKKIP
jgi:hypothetical protein